jgi:hypothetical protein
MIMFSWVLAPCGLVGRCQRFGETYCPYLQGLSDDAGIKKGDRKESLKEWTNLT